jgi:beta-lactamase regulating signal transducer with metallopeptidase domain
MIQILLFSLIAAGLVFLAGRKDAARDPRLTVLLLVLSALFPLMASGLPKFAMLPAASGPAGGPTLPWAAILTSIWTFGFAASIIRLIRAARVVECWRRRAVEVDCLDGVKICELHDLRGPVAAGVWRPVVFVPASWRDWSVEVRRAVLEHELAHHRRKDPLWRLLAELACAVHWYHPLVRWMARRFIMQCEYACDAVVVKNGMDRKTYARVLCDFAEGNSISPLALSMADRSSLESRVCRMLKPTGPPAAKLLLAMGCAGLAAACSLAMIGRKSGAVSPNEVRLRLTADPFPAER